MPSAAHLNRHRTAIALALTCAALIVIAGTSVAGIQGSGFRRQSLSLGSISANEAGTLSINDVTYSTTGATVRIDGRDASQTELRVGQVVVVRGELLPGHATPDALEISFTGDVRGPISGIDAAGGSIVVLGQRVRLSEDTRFGAGIEPASAAGLHIGTLVEVSGFATAAGEVSASQVELAAPDASLQVSGSVQGLDSNGSTFHVNALLVDFSGATIDGTLADGRTATVVGEALSGGGLRAAQIGVSTGVAGAVDQHGHFEGLITSLQSAEDFRVGNQRVLTDETTRFMPNGEPLGLDVFVRVHGTFDASGALVARDVDTKKKGAGTILGRVESFDAAAGTMTVNGVPVATSPATKFKDKSTQKLRHLGFTELRTGDTIEATGAAENGTLQANEVRLLER
jgi:hypothetical protein